ncbi:VOC family protein [Martelella soudanensis]|uniref:VOC family protein n=1 Tax=unclassified Martelella TaxID=2629616 RepID=UPI001AED5336|nr:MULTISPECIES: VOC family protein [unclassified Martelella]
MPGETTLTAVFARLIVQDVDAAIAFYQAALGADLLERHDEADGIVGFAKLGLGDIRLALSEEVAEWGWLSPQTLGGSPVLIQIEASDSAAIVDRMTAEGAETVIPGQGSPVQQARRTPARSIRPSVDTEPRGAV